MAKVENNILIRGLSGSLGAGEIAMFRFKKSGWMQADGKIYMEAESTDISYAVIQL